MDAHWKRVHRRRRLEVVARGESFTREEIAERDGYICHVCDEPVDRDDTYDQTLDHLVQIAHGGQHTRANVKLAHRRCNSQRQGLRV